LRQEGFLEIESQTSESQAPKTQKVVVWSGVDPESERQKQIVKVLIRHGGQMSLKDLLQEAKTTSATIKKLEQDKIVFLSQAEVWRDPIKSLEAAESGAPQLTEDQKRVLGPLCDHLAQTLSTPPPHQVEPWLLHGVTGSGKTEIYLRLIEQTLNLGRTALLLVPEISLTPQLASRLKSRFGEHVSIWHSALSDGERYDTWRRLRAGDVKVLLGARSAILANVPRLGLIILDEEHDGSYKQSSPAPRYHARDVAIEKGHRQGAMLVLGSATPDVSSYFRAGKNGRLLSLPKRVLDQEMPVVTTVDMREEFANGNRSIFSRLLESSLSQCLEGKEQAILLINRRGYASHVFCRACGHVLKCKNCSVSLVFHQQKNQSPATSAQNTYLNGHLACHHCGYRASSMELCPACKSPFIRQFGLGTQRVEEEVRRRYPEARILRLDSDVTVRRGAHEEILSQFTRGEADILIGTQMVAKGLDIANVTLVGVLAADAAFNLPDYRSIERGFQLLTQVSGRAGRGTKPGTVVMQTFSMEMPVLQWSKEHNYSAFYEEEIGARQTFEYPPFSQLVRVVVSGPDADEVELACEQLAEQLGNYLADSLAINEVKILGPAPCLIERLREKYRFHLLIKNMAGAQGAAVLSDFLRSKRLAVGLNLAIDVDALDLL
jgi:primosomal protein N' (replication factor Y)